MAIADTNRVAHPRDPLTADEIRAAVDLVRATRAVHLAELLAEASAAG